MKDYSFGNYICALRTGLGLSQFQLGTLVGVTDKAVSKWENGDAKPRLATCYRLSEVLGVGINELLSCEPYITKPARKELDKMNHTLWNEACEKLSCYGRNPPAVCRSRLAAEEAALHGTDAIQAYAVLGKMQRTAQANQTAMILGGTIGASFTAWLFGATQVNPLPPHYFCKKCGTVEFVPNFSNGFDLPGKVCTCGEEFTRDGHNIPYEGYAKAERSGTNIEIRLSDAFKPLAVKVLLDFYSGIAEVLPVKVHGEQDAWILERYVILPAHKGRPAASSDGFWHVQSEEFWHWQENETTFSFLISEQLNRVEKLRDATGAPPPDPCMHTTPQMAELLYQKRGASLARITKALPKEDHDFDLLTRIDLLSHATDAWENNGEVSVLSGITAFRQLPAAREDIFHCVRERLVQAGISDNGLALHVMEKAGKGFFCSRGMSEDTETLLLSLGVPSWYPDYMRKVKYLFPKAHSIAYLLADIVDAWYQLHYPEIYGQVCGRA